MTTPRDTAWLSEKLAEARPIAMSTALGVVARGGFWGFEYAYVVKAATPSTSYHESFKKLFTWQGFKEVHTEFPRTGLLPNIGKSLSTAGVLGYLDRNHADFSPLKKSVIVGVLPFEVLVTAWFDKKRTEAFKRMQKNIDAKSAETAANAKPKEAAAKPKDKKVMSTSTRRILGASYIRSSTSTVLTFWPIYEIERDLKRRFPQHANSPYLSAFAGFWGSILAQYTVVPVTNFQIRVIENTDVPIIQTAKKLLNNPWDLWRGTLARAGNRAGIYAMVFGGNGFLNKKKAPPASDLIAEKRQLKPKF